MHAPVSGKYRIPRALYLPLIADYRRRMPGKRRPAVTLRVHTPLVFPSLPGYIILKQPVAGSLQAAGSPYGANAGPKAGILCTRVPPYEGTWFPAGRKPKEQL
jgi:hypothetical protein